MAFSIILPDKSHFYINQRNLCFLLSNLFFPTKQAIAYKG